MVHGRQPYASWAAMTHWQRNDFIVRLNKKAEKDEEAHKNAMSGLKQ